MRVEVFCKITFVMVCNGIFVIDGLGWVGLGYENWTHGHVWSPVPRAQKEREVGRNTPRSDLHVHTFTSTVEHTV